MLFPALAPLPAALRFPSHGRIRRVLPSQVKTGRLASYTCKIPSRSGCFNLCWRAGASAAASAAPGQNDDRGGSSRKTEESSKALPVSKRMWAKLQHLGVRTPTKPQLEVWQNALAGKSLLCYMHPSETRSLSFLVPILERANKGECGPGKPAVILEPTRELAEQSYMLANCLRDKTVSVALLYASGGEEAFAAQRSLLKRGIHVVIGTPGRVRHMMDEGVLKLNRVSTLVVDGAEEAFSKGLEHDVSAILGSSASAGEQEAGQPQTENRQMLLFTASSSPWLQEVLAPYLRNALVVDAVSGQPALPHGVTHLSCRVAGGAMRRARLIAWLLEERLGSAEPNTEPLAVAAAATQHGGKQRGKNRSEDKEKPRQRAVIFAATRAEVVHLSTHAMLRNRTVALHGQLEQHERAAALAMFRMSRSHTLVTTDLAAKGVDFPEVRLVIHSGGVPDAGGYALRLRAAAARCSSQGLESFLLLGREHGNFDLRALEKEMQCRFTQLAAPSEDALREAAVACITQDLTAATVQYDSMAFEHDAAHHLEVNGDRVMAAALVLLERRRRAQDWVSPLSGRVRFTPLLFYDPYLKQLSSRQAVVKAITRAIRRDSEGRSRNRWRSTSASPSKQPDDSSVFIGRVELTKKGYIADVPYADVGRVLSDPGLQRRGVEVMPVTELPKLLEERVAGNRRRHRRPRQRLTLGERWAEFHKAFLYPAGHREIGGRFVNAGQKSATLS